MSRRQWENELLRQQYRHFTEGVRARMAEIKRREKCEDIADIVIDGIWKTNSEDLAPILKAVDSPAPHDGSEPSKLATEAREVLRSYLDKALDYAAELADLSDDDFDARYREEFTESRRKAKRHKEEMALARDRHDFFNRPEAEADYDQWTERLLSPVEAIALSLGKDPALVNPGNLEPFRRVGRSPFREQFEYRLILLETAVREEKLPGRMTLAIFLDWAASSQFSLPDKLRASLLPPASDSEQSWETRYREVSERLASLCQDEEAFPPKSRGSLYRLILGMAIARFEHTTSAKSDATKAIKAALEDVNLPLKEDAIRNWLRKAAHELDHSHQEAIRWSARRIMQTRNRES